MTKKLLKSMMLGVIVFAAAVLAGYLSYLFTYRSQTQQVTQKLLAPDAAAASVLGGAQPADAAQPQPDYYLARFENGDIAIYSCSGGAESFLYRLNVYAEDLPAEDLLRLREGVILRNRRELASFEEDYNS